MASPRKASAPKRPVRERLAVEERREQLREAGRALFLERPYDQVSMDDVAARAGVSKALVFHYFSTKRDLYVELVKEAAGEFLEATDVPPGTPPLERLTTGLGRYLDYVEQHSTGYLALLRSGIGVDPMLFGVVEGVRQTLAQRMLDNLPLDVPAHGHVIVRGYIGFVESSSLEWLSQRNMSREELLALWVRVLLASFRP